MFTSTRLPWFVCVCAMLILNTPTHADFIEQHASLSFHGQDYLPSGPIQFYFKKFDNHNGSLQLLSSTLRYTCHLEGQTFAENQSPNEITTPNLQMYFFANFSPLFTTSEGKDLFLVRSLAFHFRSNPFDVGVLAPNDGIPMSGEDFTQLGSLEYDFDQSWIFRNTSILPDRLEDFEGNGLLNLSIDLSGGMGMLAIIDVPSEQVSIIHGFTRPLRLDFGLTLTYEYTTIPTPGPLTLLGLAALGITRSRRRRS